MVTLAFLAHFAASNPFAALVLTVLLLGAVWAYGYALSAAGGQ